MTNIYQFTRKKSEIISHQSSEREFIQAIHQKAEIMHEQSMLVIKKNYFILNDIMIDFTSRLMK